MEAMKGRLANKYFALAEEAYGEMEEEEVETTGQWNCEEGAPQKGYQVLERIKLGDAGICTCACIYRLQTDLY